MFLGKLDPERDVRRVAPLLPRLRPTQLRPPPRGARVLERDTQLGHAAPALVPGLAQFQVPLGVHDVESGLGANLILRDSLRNREVHVQVFCQENLSFPSQRIPSQKEIHCDVRL